MSTASPAFPNARYAQHPVVAAATPAARQGNLQRVAVVSYFALGAISLMNLNGLSRMMFGFDRTVSFVILALCLVIYPGFNLFSAGKALGNIGIWFLSFLLIYIFVASLSALDRPENLYVLYTEFGGSVMVVVAAALAARHLMLTYSYAQIMRWLFLFSLVAGALVFVSVRYRGFYTETKAFRDESRFSGSFGNPNEAGMAMCIGLSIGFSYLIFAKRKMLVMAGLFFMAVALVLSFSRGAILTCGLLVFNQIIFSPVFKRKGLALAVVVMFASLSWLIFMGTQQLNILRGSQKMRLEYIANFFRTGELSEKGSGRHEVTQEGLEMCLAAPAFGNGLGALRHMPKTGLGCHNSYLMVMGEGGIIAFGMLMAFLAVFAWEGWKCPRGPLRTFVLSYVIVLAVSLAGSHKILADRNQNFILGTCAGVVAGAFELQKRNEQLKRSQQLATQIALTRTMLSVPS